MATNLVVRNIEPSVAQALREAAARHGRSAEAEHREILPGGACPTGTPILQGSWLQCPDVGADEDFNFRQA